MLVPVKWLKEYVDIDIETKELVDRLTMSGSHIDSIENVDKGFTNVVVGKIEEIQKHPNADKLLITVVNIGSEKIQIVTGAQNINEGDYVPVALVGANLPDGTKIRKGKLRGVESNGMLCSLQELGIPESLIPKEVKDGIYIFDKEYPLGKDVKEVMELYGEVIDVEVTPNRPDCLSILGMARETAATLGKTLKYPVLKIKQEENDIYDYIKSVKVEDKDLCKRYYCRVVKDIKVKPSPLWLQRRITEAGIRPINNIVDITNYVMLELGQPLHAFDLDKISGKKIIVRRANENESIITLDDVERKLDNSMLVIADDNSPIAIAGVMGGGNSEVSQDTKTILIESANFNGRSVRLTSRAISLRTEASSRFEKDIDPDIAEDACNRVCQLIEEIGAGKVIKGFIDIYDGKPEERTILLKPENVERILGVSIETDRMIEILNSLEIKSELVNGEIKANIPTFRKDLEMEIDLIEEIGRIYGFDNINPKPLVGTLNKGEKSRFRQIQDKVKETLTGMGLTEITTYSFISPKSFDKIRLPEESMKRRYVEVMNPLGEDYSVMRTTLISNMLEVLNRNYKYGVEKTSAYEIGNIFIPTQVPVKSMPYQNRVLCIGMYGNVDFFDLKGVTDELLNVLGIIDYEYMREDKHNTFHPGRTANIVRDNYMIGILGEIHPDILEEYGIKERVYVAELDLELMAFLANLERKYRPLPKFPATTRDIAVVVDKEVMVKDIEKVIQNNGQGLVDSIQLFDVYTGEQIPEGKKSVAYSIEYRSYERTLTDEEVNKVHNTIIDNLKQSLGAVLR